MKFSELERDIGFKNVDNFGKTTLLSILLALSLVPIIKYITANLIILIVYSLIGVVAIKYLRIFYSDWPKEKNKIGEIHIDNDSWKIKLNNFELHYDEIKNVKFRFNYIKGKNYAHYDVLHNGIAELVYFKTDGQKGLIKFLIETEEQLNHLKQTFKLWYQKGVHVEEEFTIEKYRTICLEPMADKSFEEIQNIKSKLKVSPVDNKWS